MKGVVEAIYGALKATPLIGAGEHALLHPGKTARTEAGVFGELHPAVLDGNWGAFEFDLELLLADARDPSATRTSARTRPSARTSLSSSQRTFRRPTSWTCRARPPGTSFARCASFDVYRGPQVGEGRKSLAFSVEFQSPERTLSDEDAAVLRQRIVDALRERFGAELRTG